MTVNWQESKPAEETYVQLLQLSNYDRIRVQQCKVEFDRHLFLEYVLTYFCRTKRSQGILADSVVETLPTNSYTKPALSLGDSAIIFETSSNSTDISSINLPGSTTMAGRFSGT